MLSCYQDAAAIMKTRLLLMLAAVTLLSACTSPWDGQDQMDIGLANAMQDQMTAHREASLAMAGRSLSNLSTPEFTPSGQPRRQLHRLQPIR